MSAVDTLRKQAEKLAGQLRDAETKRDAEQAAIRDRNQQRRQDFWTTVHTDAVPAALQAMAGARAAFTQAVANGEDVPGAYVTYCKSYAAYQAIVNATANALVRYENDLTGEPNAPGDRTGRSVHPEGLTPIHGDPADFVAMLQQATKEAAQAHGVATLAELRQPLLAELEPEDDE